MTDKGKQKAMDYKNVFSSETGERVYADLMKQCFMNVPAHDVGNVNKTFVLSGMRVVGLYIKDLREAKLDGKKPKVAKGNKQQIIT